MCSCCASGRGGCCRDETDGTIRHQPVVGAAGECICLASVEGKVLFEGWLARTMGSLIGM